MSYQPSDFPNLAEVQDVINERGDRRYKLYRTLDELNKSGRRKVYASIEEAYLNDPMVREIHQLTGELEELWRVARAKCTKVGFVTTAKRKSGTQVKQ